MVEPQNWSGHQAESKCLSLQGVAILSDSPAHSTISSLITMSPMVTAQLHVA